MYRNQHQTDVGTTVVNRRMGFGASLVWGLTGIIVTAIVAGSGLAVYALRVVDRRADGAVDLISQVLQELPEYRDALPPALSDAIDDVRQPEYRNQLKVTTRQQTGESRRTQLTSVEVQNNGDELVSLLSMRLVALDSEDRAVDECTTYAATPLQLDNDWRGPLLPGETRRFVVRWWGREPLTKVSCEITDVRVWRGPSGDDANGVKEENDSTSAAVDLPAARASRTRIARHD